MENEEDEEEEEEEDEEDEEDDDEDEIQDILDDLEENEGSFIIEDGVNASESSVSLQFMMKLFFQLPEDTRLYLLDQMDNDRKISFTLSLASVLNLAQTNQIHIQQHKQPKKSQKPKQNTKSKSEPKVIESKPKPKKQSVAKPNPKTAIQQTSKQVDKKVESGDKSNSENTERCSHIFVRGKNKGKQCETSGSLVGDNKYACYKHKNVVEKKKEKKTSDKSTTKKTTKTPKILTEAAKTAKATKEVKKDDIPLSKVVHLCNATRNSDTICNACTSANIGDLRVCAYPHKNTRTPEEISGFLKVNVLSAEETWTLVFVNVDTSFDSWNLRYNAYDSLKDYFNEANSVRYKQLPSGRSAYQLICDPMIESKGELVDKTDRSDEKSDSKSDTNEIKEIDNNTNEIEKEKEEKGEEIENSVDKDNIKDDTKVQKDKIKSILQSSKKQKGEKWNLISTKWFLSWKEYVSYNVSNIESSAASLLANHPGPIDNSELVHKDENDLEELASGLQERDDYELIPEEAWNYLYSIYSGGPKITRPLSILKRDGFNILGVDLYPVLVMIVSDFTSNGMQYGPYPFSEESTVQDIIRYGINKIAPMSSSATGKLYRYFQGEKKEQYEDTTITLQEAGICGGTVFLEINASETEFSPFQPIPV